MEDAGSAPPTDAGGRSYEDAWSLSVGPERHAHEEPLEPSGISRASNLDGLAPLCEGGRVGVYESQPYRGVRPRDNGGGWCCPQSGTSFLCVMSRGMQHTPLLTEEAHFYARENVSVSFLVDVSENTGMRNPARPLAHLAATRTSDGFTLRVLPEGTCRSNRANGPELGELCRREGVYRYVKGLPVQQR